MTIQQAFDLAYHHHQAGRLNEAESIYLKILAVEPRNADALHLIGVIKHQLGKNDLAVDWIRQSITIQPGHPGAHNNLGEAHRVAGQLDEAIAAYHRAIFLQSDYPEVHNNLGNALRSKGHLDEAIASYRQALTLKPGFPDAHNNLGNALKEKGYLDEAIASYRQALALKPNFPEAHNNLGNAFKDKGQLDEAFTAYRQALALRPNYPTAHSNLVFCMNYHPGLEVSSIAEEHLHWSRQHGEPLRSNILPHTNDRSPDRCLRVGFISPDFRNHSVAFFLEGLFEHQDPTQVEVFCYAEVANPDAMTARIRQLAGHWLNITGLPDADVAELIRNDGIDILIDLAGHTAKNRLLVFTHKPAPVQVTWLGYPNTTGLSAIDYRITDKFADPPGSTEHLHSEQLVRLPRSAWCYRPPENSPPVSTLPAHDRGYITFGCFNAMPKINGKLLELWANILLAVPSSRLLLKNRAIGEPSLQKQIRSVFEQVGIDSQRLQIVGHAPVLLDHLATYGQVDIALDTFPYHGTTTTCEALWMGVPVVTLAGKTHVSRVGVSLLSNLEHHEWIADSPEEYVKITVEAANDLTRLAELRSNMREKIQTSPLLDVVGFARDMENAYRNMWRKWCEHPEWKPQRR